jgi:hypothetical protein
MRQVKPDALLCAAAIMQILRLQVEQVVGKTALQMVEKMASRLPNDNKRATLKKALSSIASLKSWHKCAAASDAAAAGEGSSSTGSKGAVAGAAQVRSQPGP